MSSLPEPAAPLAGLVPAAERGAGPVSPGEPRRQALPHVIVLLLCLGALGAAALLSPGPGEGLRIGGLPLPEVCALRRATDLPCPGCGLSRSWVLLVRGDLAASVALHPLGWLLFAYAGLQAGRHAAWLAMPRWRTRLETGGRWLDRGAVALALLLALAWVPRLLAAIEAAR